MKNMLHHFEEIDKEKFIVITDNAYKTEYEKLGISIVPIIDYLQNPQAIVKAIKLHEKYRFKKIIALEEVDVDKSCIVSEILNLKQLSIVEGKNYRNKYLMKKMLPLNSLFKIPKIQKASDDIKDLTYPCILKNDSLYAAREVFRIEDSDHLLNMLAKIDSSNYVIEEYIHTKKMISLDGYLFNDEIYCLYIHEYSQSILEYMTDEVLSIFITSTSMLNDNVKEYKNLSQIILFITKHLNYGSINEMLPFHLELFYDEEKGEYTFCEIGKRFGGGKITELIEWAFDIDMTKDMYDFEVKGINPIKKSIVNNHKYSASIRIPGKPGLITNMPNFEKYEFVVSNECNYKVGDIVDVMEASNSCIVTVCICAKSRFELDSYIEIINYEYQKNMKIKTFS
jgi:hypothetical protein